MSKNIVQWIVEKVDETGAVIYERTFDDYKEALEIYETLKESTDSNVSLHKTTKKLLVE
jgi:hypothetical protein